MSATYVKHSDRANSLDPLPLVNSTASAVFAGGGEFNLFLGGDDLTLCCIWRVVNTGTLKYSYATNADGTTWAAAQTLSVTGLFPEVRRHGTTLYMVLADEPFPGSARAENAYWYSAALPVNPTTKPTFAIQNGGVAVIQHDGSAVSNWCNRIYNVGFDITAAGKIMYAVEGTSNIDAGTGGRGSGPFESINVGVCTATLASPGATLPALPTLYESSNPFVRWIPERNAWLMICGDVSPGLGNMPALPESLALRLRARWIYDGNNNDLSNGFFWRSVPLHFLPTDGSQSQPGDFAMEFSTQGQWAATAICNVNQATGQQYVLPKRSGISSFIGLLDRLAGSYPDPADAVGMRWQPHDSVASLLRGSPVFTGGAMSVLGPGRDYTYIYCGKDVTHFGNFVWDALNNRWTLQTYSNAYPIRLEGSALQFASPATFLSTIAGLPTADVVSASLGSNYVVTGSYANSGLSVTLPKAGRWAIFAFIQAYAVGAANGIVVKLRNATDSADVGNEQALILQSVSSDGSFSTMLARTVVTAGVNRVVALYAKLSGSTVTADVLGTGNQVSELFAVRLSD